MAVVHIYLKVGFFIYSIIVIKTIGHVNSSLPNPLAWEGPEDLALFAQAEYAFTH